MGLARENGGWVVNLFGNIKSKQIIGLLSAKEGDSDVGRVAVQGVIENIENRLLACQVERRVGFLGRGEGS